MGYFGTSVSALILCFSLLRLTACQPSKPLLLQTVLAAGFSEWKEVSVDSATLGKMRSRSYEEGNKFSLYDFKWAAVNDRNALYGLIQIYFMTYSLPHNSFSVFLITMSSGKLFYCTSWKPHS